MHAEQIAVLIFLFVIIFVPVMVIIGLFRGGKAFVGGVAQGYENSWRREQRQKGFSDEQIEAMLNERGKKFSSFLLGNVGKVQIVFMTLVAIFVPLSIPFFIWLCIRQYKQWQLLQQELRNQR